MKDCYIVRSTKNNKNGHVDHIVIWDGKYFTELSPATGKALRNGVDFFPAETAEETITRSDYRIVDVNTESAHFTGFNTRFADTLVDAMRGEF